MDLALSLCTQSPYHPDKNQDGIAMQQDASITKGTSAEHSETAEDEISSATVLGDRQYQVTPCGKGTDG